MERLAPGPARRLRAGAARLAAGEPLAYVLGSADFYGRPFFCDRRALIPRPETEQLLDLLLKDRSLWRRPRPRIAEVGVGSGCLVVTAAIERPAGRYIGTDLSPGALALARRNAARHRMASRIRLVRRDLLAGIRPSSLAAVVSNLPYIPTAEWRRLERGVKDFEPRAALDGGADGLSLIRRLLPQAHRALEPGGRLFLEIGDRHGPAARALAAAAGFRDAETRPDLAGRTRFLLAGR